jgi:hypothetical protein
MKLMKYKIAEQKMYAYAAEPNPQAQHTAAQRTSNSSWQSKLKIDKNKENEYCNLTLLN